MQTPGLGALIVSAFGYVAGSTAVPETAFPNSPAFATGAPNLEPQGIKTVANGSPRPLMIDGSPVQKDSNGAIVAAGQTVAQGSQATIAEMAVSVGSKNVVIDSSVHDFSPLAAETPTPLIIGGYTRQRGPDGGLGVASQTITPGVKATVAGNVVSVGSDNTILYGTTYSLAPISPIPLPVIVNGITTALQASSPVINIAGQEYSFSQASSHTNAAGEVLPPGTPSQQTPYIIAGQTLTPGGVAIIVSGISISLLASQALTASSPATVVDESAIQAEGSTPMTVGNQVFTQNPSAFVVAGTTISAGAPGITVVGTVLSLRPNGLGLVLGSSTLLLSPFLAGASLSSSGGGANPADGVGSSTSAGASSIQTPGGMQSSSPGNSVRPSSTTQSAQTTNNISSAVAHLPMRPGSVLLVVVASLVVGGILEQW